ncbi:MBL fold metallo-hydrolase [Candidatus Thorarchaeota archaeon]|nr:MAG: MBL fold metallo-hydrolase [Candidatus Thorarchaeota archaeon]
MSKMASTEIIPGVHIIKGKFAGEFGFIASYLIVSEGEALLIDPGTAGDPGDNIEKALKDFGLNHKSDLIGIVCTHGHPDHAGGAGRLRKATGAPVMIHSEDAELLRDPSSFLNERLLMDRAQRMAMKFDKGPLRVNYREIEPDNLLTNGQQLQVGDISLNVIHTGGHSAGHCVFYEPTQKMLFSGDEVTNFPNDPRKFYVDLSGSIVAKVAALESLSKLDLDYLLPAHDVPALFGDVRIQFEGVRDGIIHLQDTVLSHLEARGEADIQQLEFDIRQSRSVPIPLTLDALIATTIKVILDGLAEAGLVKDLGKGIWVTI